MLRTSVKLIAASPPEEWKKIIANAKFTDIQQLLMTRVGINNFIHLAINFSTSMPLRDIIVNSPYISAWGRSTQVLNKTDSMFSVYQAIDSSNDNYHAKIIDIMDEMYTNKHVQDNIRMLVPLGSITDYSISIDIMTTVKLIFTLESVVGELANEAITIAKELRKIILETYSIDEKIIETLRPSYTIGLDRDFQFLAKDLGKVTGLPVEKSDVTYSVVGQILRHRTVYKNFDMLLDTFKNKTNEFDYNFIDTPSDIAVIIKELTQSAKSIYEVVQGSITTVNFSGYPTAISKMFDQRSCCINDTKQFANIIPNSAIPPCKCNVGKFGCYVSYVNESRLKNEELTQVPCPIWAENQNISQFTNDKKYDFYYKHFTSWKKWKQKITRISKTEGENDEQ